MHRIARCPGCDTRVVPFNSRFLGFFYAPFHAISLSWLNPSLSIPVSWDFSMHLLILISVQLDLFYLSIPVSWDFSMHPSRFWLYSTIGGKFIHYSGYVVSIIIEMSFNL